MAQTASPTSSTRSVPFPSPTLAEDILKSIQALVVVFNSLGDAVYVSPSIERILGYGVPEVIGAGYFELVRSADGKVLTTTRDRLKRIARGDSSLLKPHATQLRTKTGDSRWILWNDAKGPSDLVIAAGQDITELRNAEEELDRRQREFRAVFEASSDGMLILNSAWVYIMANPAACRIFGLPPERIVGTEQGTLLKSNVDVEDIRQRALANGGVTAEAEFFCTDGESRHVEYSIIPFFRADHHLIIMRDITERRRLEGQLAQAQKLEAVGRLAGGVAHDFNNMLTSIQGYGELLLKKYPEGSFRKYVEGILAATDRAAQTTQQLLAFSRKQVLQPRLLRINMAIGDTISLLQRIIGEDIELSTVLAPDAGNIMVDPGQFSHVLMNLAVNARDAMPSGGKLIIETRRVQLDDDYVLKHIQVQAGKYVMLAVSDTGVGIPPEIREHIFEPFFTTKPQGKGSGLGLSTVYGIVKQSSGYVWVYSEPGEGSTFKIYFPQAPPDLEGEAAEPEKTLNILVIEDDDLIRSLTTTVLREQGHTVIEASDGRSALIVCHKFEGVLDLVITDVSAPGMSGEDLMGFFAVKYPKVAVVHMSGFSKVQLATSNGIPRNAYFLSKPFTMKQLLEIIQQVLENQERPRPC